ncbi:MAG: ThuA domain-containing protein [Zavarzinella sp.]
MFLPSRRTALAAGSATIASAVGFPLMAEQPTKKRKLVMIAGTPSHGPGMHEHNAGVLLFQKCLQGIAGLDVEIVLNGYPKDDSMLDGADAIFVYADGGGRHPLIQGERIPRIDKLIAKGVGLFCCHFGVEVPKGKPGDAFRTWIGGCYEHEWSCNPMWKAEFTKLPDHPICRGVKPFAIFDEWYFNMRFRPELQGVTPILTATPTDATRDGPYVYPKGPYKHIQEAKGRPEHVMWCTERPDGGRGVGFTGGHFHINWQNNDFRKLVLNALLWISKVDVPQNGVASEVTDEEMKKNLDPKGKKK